ncbi:hydroxypyruvate isomerase [Ereboglobus sp. PH5-10]|uniref:hydroxypyruvate isomerase family protein n=1 Tax=Ereboglobus sp. PH5-10 TaxID=2940629 RepID=UPI002404D29F|nr:TIM barrel protein [Ereboglobus sp. PH5-10]MDF9828574.1 hydroxypyruvate isomerase [Ereboglobus sp. PH5-10]
MNRRQALKTIATTGALAALSRVMPSARAGAASENSNPKPDMTSSFRHSVCAWCYIKKIPLPEFAPAAKKAGVESIELLDPAQWPVVQKHGLACAVANGPKSSSIKRGFNRREHHANLVPDFLARIKECAAAGIPNLICFSGNRDGQSDEEGLEICAEGLKKIVSAAEKARVTIIMELLNSKVNHKDYQCDHTAWGVELVKRVGSERFKLLYDIYHMQIMEGDVIRNIRENAQYIAHYHTAGNPGRNEFEPTDTQELNYPAIMRAIRDTGYRGYIGQEFLPKRDPLTSLAAAVKICTV